MGLRVAVVTSTVGRASVRALLESLAAQTLPPHQVVVTDQSGGPDILSIVAAYRDRLPVALATSERGASAGRNAGFAALRPVDVVFFTDDDCILDPTALERAAALIDSGVDIVTGRVESTLGARGQADAADVIPVTRDNVWTYGLEAATAIRFDRFIELRGFDQRLGVGADSPWQSGEGTDLMIRALGSGLRIRHAPTVVVREEAPALSADQIVDKSRRYARGTAKVYLMHYPVPVVIAVALRPLAGAARSAVRRDWDEARRLWAVSQGRIAVIIAHLTGRAPSSTGAEAAREAPVQQSRAGFGDEEGGEHSRQRTD